MVCSCYCLDLDSFPFLFMFVCCCSCCFSSSLFLLGFVCRCYVPLPFSSYLFFKLVVVGLWLQLSCPSTLVLILFVLNS